MHNILNRIIKIKNKEYLIVSYNNWIKYLNNVSPYRLEDKTLNCNLNNNSENFWCDSCNTNKQNWKNCCINNITRKNLYKYSDIFLFEEKNKIKRYTIKKILD